MSNTELADDLRGIIDQSKLTVVCGDFNMCFIDQRQNNVTEMLERCGFTQLNQDASHFQGGHIDHVYTNHSTKKFQVHVSQYCPYYLAKDHNDLLITITKTPGRSFQNSGKYSARI